MRRLHSQLQNSFAALAVLCLVLFLLPCAAKARAHAHHAHRSHRPHPLRVHARRRRHVHPHTARALRRARRHGTRAVQEAAREETARVAREEDTDVNTATATVPEVPLAAMHLPPLRGSHESLVRQNTRAEQEGILRIRDDQDLLTLRQQGRLVALPESAALHVDPRLPANRRYCRIWVSRFLANLSRAHYERFHRPLQVNSAVRTIAFQEHLRHINGNAAPAEGDVASPHLTGEAVDLAKKGLSPSEVAWMRAYLLPLQSAGKIDVEEEFKQSCFHISVYQSYLPKHDPASHPPELMASGMH